MSEPSYLRTFCIVCHAPLSSSGMECPNGHIQTFVGQVTDLAAKANHLTAELAAAKDEIHRKNTHLLCSFCSFEVRIDDEKEALKAIQKHVAEECKYHPITKLLKDVKAELVANAKMLARQTRLTQETETQLAETNTHFRAAEEKLKRVREHCTGEPVGRSDEDIPDEDKCAAHEMGYVDAQTNIQAILTEPEGGSNDA